MHIVTILRYYIGLSQMELSQKTGVAYADLNEIENMKICGMIDKFKRLAEYLHVPVHTILTNDFLAVSEDFFRHMSAAEYIEPKASKNSRLGRLGEDAAFHYEQHRLEKVNHCLARLVLPKYKLRGSRGYDIISYKEDGTPFFIEVKTSENENNNPQLTGCEFQTAVKLTNKGYEYWIYNYSGWGTENMTFEKHLFYDLQEEKRIVPVRYLCNFKSNKDTENGILHFRKLMGISQIDAAKMLKIPPSSLCKYETGESQCPAMAYLKMAKLYHVTIDDLLDEYPLNECI